MPTTHQSSTALRSGNDEVSAAEKDARLTHQSKPAEKNDAAARTVRYLGVQGLLILGVAFVQQPCIIRCWAKPN